MMNWRAFVACIAVMLLTLNVQAQSQLEKDLQSFRTWMNRKATQADSVTRAEWPIIKESFKAATSRLDQQADSLSKESKQEYAELKLQYQEMEVRQEGQYGQPLNPAEAIKWEKELAGRTKLSKIKPDELRPVFTYFMEGVRGQKANWSLRDWEYAEHVYLELSNRKQVLLDRLSNGDKIRIAALQVEFNSLRTSRDVQNKYEEMRDKR